MSDDLAQLAAGFSLGDSERLMLLTLWGMRPNWTPPEHVQRALNFSYASTPWPSKEVTE